MRSSIVQRVRDLSILHFFLSFSHTHSLHISGSGHFSDITGFLNRQPLSFRDPPVALASSYPYVAALTTAGTVEIHSVFNPNPRNVSTFTFPSPAKSITSNGNLIVVATISQFYLLVSTAHKHR